MNNDIHAALMGNKEAAKRLTDAGALIPCGHCKGRAVLVEGKLKAVGKYSVVCGECFCATTWCTSKEDAIGRWNTRAPILSEEEIQKLEGNT